MKGGGPVVIGVLIGVALLLLNALFVVNRMIATELNGVIEGEEGNRAICTGEESL